MVVQPVIRIGCYLFGYVLYLWLELRIDHLSFQIKLGKQKIMIEHYVETLYAGDT